MFLTLWVYVLHSLLDSKLSDSLYKTNPHIIDVPAIDEKIPKITMQDVGIFRGNQKRTAYVRMAIGLRGLERKCPLVCLWASLLDSLIVIPAMTMHNIVHCRLLTKNSDVPYLQKSAALSKTVSKHGV